jgi:hypothetical protein
MGGQKPVFFENIWLQAKRWEKTRFLKIVRECPETWFLREYFVTGEERSIANASILLLGFRRCSIR